MSSVAMVSDAFDRLLAGMAAGANWPVMGDTDPVRALLNEVLAAGVHKKAREGLRTLRLVARPSLRQQ